RRDGLDVGTAGSAESSFTDDAAVPTGSHVYEVALLSGQNALCAASCRVTVTGVPIGSAGACGGVVNTYDFDGDLKSSTGGRDLVPFVSLPIDLVTGTPDFSFETAEIAGKEAQVCRYSRGTCFRLYTGSGPNGGGIYTNQYTIIFDLLFEPAALDESGWAALYQTNDVNGNDGDYFIRAQDRGVGIDDNYGGYVADGEWHRVAVVVDLVAGTLRSYVDGVVAQENAAQGRDGRFSLYSTADGDLEGISVFADDSGDNSAGLVGSVQIRDVPLSEDEVRAFGGPSADGIPPQPLCPYGLACRLELASKTVTLEWNSGAAPGTALVVKRNGVEIASVPAGASTYTDPGVPAGALVYELATQAAASCANLPLVTEVFVPKSSYFFEDFDAYEDDAALAAADWESNRAGSPAENADWTVLNPGRRPPPPTFNGRPSGGRFVISDSAYAGSEAVQNEAGSGAAYELWSPSFSTQGAASVWLHFDAAAQLNNNGDAVFNVDVSTDGGASWSNVLERVSPGRQLEPLPTVDGNADGLHGRVHVDLTADAANKPSVRLRFTHFEPTWDWWVALDNVLVDGDSPDGGGPVVLPAESFSGGIPAAWKHDPGPGSDGADPWSTEDTCQLSLEATGGTFPDTADGRQLHHLGGAFALIDPICSAALVDEYLITPAFDLSGQARAILSVRSAILFTHTAVAEILLSLDGGATFLPVPVFRYGDGSLTVSGEEPYFDELSIDVPAAVGKANVAFAFHYAGNQPTNPAKGWWAIDDVSVTGGETVGLPRFHRGDADDNGQLQLTDAIRILGRLFLGQGTISCEDAADSDDSGSLQLTDAIRILGVLFLGQGEIPPPGGPPAACGVDPGEDALGCESYSSCN
ncbi:MAG TPA: choice-of-anchor J domain-containing protein, partial [Planctomycetota bacterium]|nr:choice-of-anchor J domain-containing protein [Planctomycetota bacterium]